MKNHVSLYRAVKLMQETDGKVFRASFIKRTTGELRHMVCRTGVTKGVTGKGMNYDPADKGLMTVFDFQKKQFRMIALDGLKALRIAHKTYRVK